MAYDLKTAGPSPQVRKKKALRRTKGAREKPGRSLAGVENPTIPGLLRGPGAVENIGVTEDVEGMQQAANIFQVVPIVWRSLANSPLFKARSDAIRTIMTTRSCAPT